MSLFMPTPVIYIFFVFLGATPALEHGVTVYLLDMYLLFDAAGFETDGTRPCLLSESWILAFLI